MAKSGEHRIPLSPLERDIRICPYCRAGLMQFSEHPQSPDWSPAWFCDNPDCGYRMRPAKSWGASFVVRRRVLLERSVTARRRSMVALARADRWKRESARIRARSRRKDNSYRCFSRHDRKKRGQP
jgi:hypothetical protein